MEKAEPKAHAAEAKSRASDAKSSGREAASGNESAAREANSGRPQFQAQIPPSAARDSALSRAVQQIEKQFGKGAVMKLDGKAIAPIEGEMGDSPVGLQARLMSQALRKLTGAISKSKCTVIFINQIREKIGVMFGNPETTPGGRALKFYSSIRIDVRRTGTIKEAEVSIGNRTRARVVKNKIAPPFRDAEFDIMFDRGISYEGDLLDLAALGNVVEKSGAWYNYKSTRLGQGRENAKQFLFENKDITEEIRQTVLSIKGLVNAKPVLDAPPAEELADALA